MSETVLGMDCGGTHTDAALMSVEGGRARLLAGTKTPTRHDDLPGTIADTLEALADACPREARTALVGISRITLGATLGVNALLQGRADTVALALSAGPGLDPAHFGLGAHVCVVPGGLDHRGAEVAPLRTDELEARARAWPVAAWGAVGKFSPRNPAHEEKMARAIGRNTASPVYMGHSLSGRLNFPRRIATTYFNAACAGINARFLDAVEAAIRRPGAPWGRPALRLLKADGGAIPFGLARKYPVQSILSGPSASVMGALAQWAGAREGCRLLLDMGGTTTDIAMALDGSPVLARGGMELMGRRTLVRALAQTSIAVGGDSRITAARGRIAAGPLRDGPAMAFGGAAPTLLDALNVINAPAGAPRPGDAEASARGIGELAAANGMEAGSLARAAVDDAMRQIVRAALELAERVNASPIYTLAGLRAAREARPDAACLVGGPADAARAHVEAALGMPVSIPPEAGISNAVGAGLTLPTDSLEIYVDTGTGRLTAPAIGHAAEVRRGCTLDEARREACRLLAGRMAEYGEPDAEVEAVEADLFATLDERGRGSKDMRVTAQARPGLMATL